MPIIDLTLELTDRMPAYPGDPSPRLEQLAQVDDDGYNLFELHSSVHVGTHLDAPLHMFDGADSVADVALDRLIGHGVIIDARGVAVIDAAVLKGARLGPGAIVLVRTDWSNHFWSPTYFTDHPIVADDFADAIVQCGASVLGLDTPSPDRAPFPIHRALLGAGIPIIENLVHLSALEGASGIRVLALPLRLRADAAPVRVIAEVDA